MIPKLRTCILTAVCLAVSLCAHAQSAEATQLMQATNQDRAQHGLGPLRWDPALARAAQAHAHQMVRHGELSHQYAGEPDLMTRAGHDGAHFSTVAENVAVAPNPQSVESEWMHSPPHRHNILDPRLTTVGIGLVRQGNNLWAVEDFSAAVVQMGSSQIEQKVEQMVAERGIRSVTASERRPSDLRHGSRLRRNPSEFHHAMGRLRSEPSAGCAGREDQHGPIQDSGSRRLQLGQSGAGLHLLPHGGVAVLMHADRNDG